MARKVIMETAYTFTPTTRTITIPKAIPRERLLLITNVTQNQVIYNFSDPSLNATTYTAVEANGTELTTIVLNYNTASMLTTDKLSITIDEYDETFQPAETLMDTTNKFRVTTPQSLIDTDFEYGTQVTKWENLGLYNNRPFAYTEATPIQNIGSITFPTGSASVTVSLTSGVGPLNGSAITVQDTYLQAANGNFIVETGGGTSTFVYSAAAKNNTSITNILDTNKTAIYRANRFTGARIGFIPVMSYSGNRIDVTTTISHGLSLGNEIVVTGATATTNAPNGNFTVAQILSPTRFAYFANAIPTGTLGGPTEIYVRPQAVFLHRPADGGVIFSTNSASNYAAAIRQTRRYFRYQSGKGIQASSGTIMKPYAGIDSITSVGTTVTVYTKEKHNILPGTQITIGGCNETAYNGTFTINNITGFNSFEYTALSTPTSTVASGNYFASIVSWYGCQNRLGLFDDQNGVFFEFDGQQLYAVRRSSTFQLSGRVTVTNGDDTVSQTDGTFRTFFNKQLIPGDYIVLRGQSYKVDRIIDDTALKITPAYRGATAQYCIASKTVDTRIPQSQFNMDKADGTGPSQYTMDLSKMQMFYIDYTWYGAGFIRWGVRGPKGNVIYLHKMQNNNVNTEAYMRSGNLPGRYSSTTIPPYTNMTATLLSTDLALQVTDTSRFPSSGTLVIRDNTNYEYVNYSGKTATSFTGLKRARAGISAYSSLTISAGRNVGALGNPSDANNLQVGMQIASTDFPDGTYIANVSDNNSQITFSGPAAIANPTITFVPMGVTAPIQFTFSPTSPTICELVYPTFGSSISHWGTAVIMDGRFDDDKSLIFTYGQRTSISVPSGQTRVLLGIRNFPSADNGIGAPFGARETVNRMQLTLKALDITATSGTGTPSMLVSAILNGVPSTGINWTNAVGNQSGQVNSSLAQIADYAGQSVTMSGGETTGGFFTSGTTSVDLSSLRDLGNSILAGGGTTTTQNIYPDGPDVLHITVTNLGSSTANVFSRLSWTEAQA